MPKISEEEFMARYAEVEHGVRSFVFSLLPNRNAADDVIQETVIQLWQNIDSFDSDRPLFPWACRFAYRQVLMYRRKASSRMKFFSEATLDQLNAASPQREDVENARVAALKICIAGLQPQQQFLIEQRYNSQTTLAKLAVSLGKSVDSLYKSLERTRRALAECVTQRLANGEQ